MLDSKYTGSEETTETLVLGAHYDDRGSFGEVRAPGANDDASGTAALLGIARAIARRGVVFKANVLFCAFAGEEQGMIGSKAYASKCYSNIVFPENDGVDDALRCPRGAQGTGRKCYAHDPSGYACLQEAWRCTAARAFRPRIVRCPSSL